MYDAWMIGLGDVGPLRTTTRCHKTEPSEATNCSRHDSISAHSVSYSADDEDDESEEVIIF
jgi:hypothetical protein